MHGHLRSATLSIAVSAVFTALMLLLRERMALNIAVSAAFVFGVFLLLRFHVAGAQETAQ